MDEKNVVEANSSKRGEEDEKKIKGSATTTTLGEQGEEKYMLDLNYPPTEPGYVSPHKKDNVSFQR